MYSVFNNDEEMANQFIKLSVEHQKADEYIYASNDEFESESGTFKSCGVGWTIRDILKYQGKYLSLIPHIECTIYSDHAVYAENLGVPLFIPAIHNAIFYGLSFEEGVKFTPRLFRSMKESLGKDLSCVLPKFYHMLLKINKNNNYECFSTGNVIHYTNATARASKNKKATYLHFSNKLIQFIKEA